jgi:prevent-host-death family protein
MKTVGIFEAKTRLTAVCEEVARTHQPVTVTRRGKPLVRIDPVEEAPLTINERRDAYMADQGKRQKRDTVDFEVPPRSRDVVDFAVEDGK